MVVLESTIRGPGQECRREEGSQENRSIGVRLSKAQVRQCLARIERTRHSQELYDAYSKQDDMDYFLETTGHFMRRDIGLFLEGEGILVKSMSAFERESVVEHVLEEICSVRYNYMNDPEMQDWLSQLTHVKYDHAGPGQLMTGSQVPVDEIPVHILSSDYDDTASPSLCSLRSALQHVRQAYRDHDRLDQGIARSTVARPEDDGSTSQVTYQDVASQHTRPIVLLCGSGS
eukprot:TRINITY_DN1361_c0_g1_i13.p1 TRINITY_DN1361_c0_g1~~TRINITY_DN1361_c0_g1_i13.p1  ORF type:complete len:231 (-),score=11.66 TRINITY_DN1361_c0_g1_i13:787-1479(-)